MAKRHPATLVGLDLGSAKTAVVIAQANNGSAPQVVGVGESYTLGVENGVVTNVKAVADSIGQALIRTGRAAGIRKLSAYAGCQGLAVTTRKCMVAPAADGRARGRVCFQNMTVEGIPPGEKLLTIVPGASILSLLKSDYFSEARAITASNRHIENMVESARLAGLAVREVIYGPLAAAEALLSPAEKELGTLLIDLGATATTVAVMDQGRIRENTVLAVGGEHIVTDLAIVLHTSLAQAREIVKQYHRDWAYRPGYMEVSRSDQEKTVDVAYKFIHTIIGARVQEIADLITGAVEQFAYPGQLPGGAVLYGGAALMEDLSALVAKHLRLAVRTGSYKNAGLELGPHYANAFGLVKYGFSLASI